MISQVRHYIPEFDDGADNRRALLSSHETLSARAEM